MADSKKTITDKLKNLSENEHIKKLSQNEYLKGIDFTPQNLSDMFFSFKGRMDRKTFWMIVLFQFSVYVAVFILGLILDLITQTGFFTPLFMLVLFVPNLWTSLATGAKRLQDINKPSWFLLLLLVPFVGPLVLLYFYVQPSLPEEPETQE